jgi:hypothetical protein
VYLTSSFKTLASDGSVELAASRLSVHDAVVEGEFVRLVRRRHHQVVRAGLVGGRVNVARDGGVPGAASAAPAASAEQPRRVRRAGGARAAHAVELPLEPVLAPLHQRRVHALLQLTKSLDRSKFGRNYFC